MDQQHVKNGEESPSPHTLVIAETTGGRRHAGRFYLAAAALVVGVLAAFVWLSQPFLGEIGQPPVATKSAVATVTAVPAVEAAPTADPSPPQSEPVVAAARPAVAAEANAPAIQPTRTPTPIPYLDSIEAVVGLGGAQVWNVDGSAAGQLPQGALVSATMRSADNAWVLAQSEEGIDGWMAVDDLILFDTDRLAPEDVAITPMTPTPLVAEGDGPGQDDVSAPDDTQPRDSSAIALPTITPPTGKGLSAAGSGASPKARIALEDSRLNIRAGPGASHRVIAKAFPEEMYALLAVSDDGVWVQIELPNISGGFGWAAAEFLQTSGDLTALPVSSEVSSARSYHPGDEAWPAQPVDAPEPVPAPQDGALPPMRPGPPALGGKVSSASDSPTGLTGTLVIQKEWGGDIYVYDLETGDLRLLTGGFDPSISPDGAQVAFTREGGENGVYIIDIHGGEERLLFGGREHLRSPKFSPDGQFIVFERGDESILCKDDPARCRLSVKGPDGDLPERETQPSLARIRVDGSDYWDPMDLPYARVPDWNEGGIVYQSLGGLQIAQNEPNVDTELVYFDILKQYEMDPDWQPGEGAIAFQQREISHWEIFVVNPDGSGLHALTKPPFPLAESLPSNVSPAWSPDGRHVVYLSNRAPDDSAGEWGVWVMDADGGNQRRLPIELPFVYTYVSEQMLDWGP